MRHPDVSLFGTTHVWHVPLGRVREWVRDHPEKVPLYARDERFDRIWRDLWYMRWVSGGDYDDELAEARWFAISLRDIRDAPPEWPRMYQEAEWELCAENLDATPPLNGDGLYDQLDEPPLFVYQFHGLSDTRVLNVGNGETFAIFGWQALAHGNRPIEQMCVMLSTQVNQLRSLDGLEPLRIATGDDPRARELWMWHDVPFAGLLCELDDGSPITYPERSLT